MNEIEKGQTRNPGFLTIAAIAQHLRVSLDTFMPHEVAHG